MTFKNSIKILFSNFNIVWKIMLYFLLLFALSIVGIYICVSPIVKMIDTAGFFSQIVDMYKKFITSLDLAKAFETISNIIDGIIEYMSANISRLWINFVGIGLVILLFNFVIAGFANMASCVSLHFYMGSLTKQGFYTSFKDSFGKNLKAQFCKLLVMLPINACGILLFVLYLKLFKISWIVSLVSVFGLIICFVLFTALKYALFASWIPTIVVLNFGVFKSLKVSLKSIFKRFWRVYGTSVGIVLSIIALNVFFGLFTFFVGLIISIPISYLLYNIFGMVLVYEGQGMKYYVDIYNVITPKKKEVSDRLKDMKYFV